MLKEAPVTSPAEQLMERAVLSRFPFTRTLFPNNPVAMEAERGGTKHAIHLATLYASRQKAKRVLYERISVQTGLEPAQVSKYIHDRVGRLYEDGYATLFDEVHLGDDITRESIGIFGHSSFLVGYEVGSDAYGALFTDVIDQTVPSLVMSSDRVQGLRQSLVASTFLTAVLEEGILLRHR